MSMLLRVEQIEAAGVHGGLQGLDYLNGNAHPALIILDLMMPVMDGREFFKQARLADYPGPVVFCSAYGAAAANTEMGGQGAIEKPFEPEHFVDVVRRCLANSPTQLVYE